MRRRWLPLVVLAAAFGASGVAPIVSQTRAAMTPQCADVSDSSCFPQRANYQDRDGEEVALIEVTAFGSAEPLTPAEGYAAPAGHHYVVIGVGIWNDGKQPLTIDPPQFLIYNVIDGFIYAGLDLPTDSFPGHSLLRGQTLQPGESTGGEVLFLISDEDVLYAVYYRQESDRMIQVASVCDGCAGSGGRTRKEIAT
jgi:hypothetical protein